MEKILLPVDEFKELINKIDNLEKKIDSLSKKQPLEETWLDNQEVMQILKIANRTLQEYRSSWQLSYSQFGGKIYYRALDIQNHLLKHYKPAFKGNKNVPYVK